MMFELGLVTGMMAGFFYNQEIQSMPHGRRAQRRVPPQETHQNPTPQV